LRASIAVIAYVGNHDVAGNNPGGLGDGDGCCSVYCCGSSSPKSNLRIHNIAAKTKRYHEQGFRNNRGETRVEQCSHERDKISFQ
jgi:hypothetical protein